MANEIEIWKDIPGFEGSYMASNLGMIKSLERTVYKVMNGGGVHGYKRKERLLKQFIPCDYYMVRLYSENGVKNCLVHVLISDTFSPCSDKTLVVNHEDGNKLNNRANNLSRMSRSQNQLHAIKMGLQKYKRGEDHYLSKLKNNEVSEIKKLVFAGFSQAYVASRFEVSRTLINTIVKGKQRVYG